MMSLKVNKYNFQTFYQCNIVFLKDLRGHDNKKVRPYKFNSLVTGLKYEVYQFIFLDKYNLNFHDIIQDTRLNHHRDNCLL